MEVIRRDDYNGGEAAAQIAAALLRFALLEGKQVAEVRRSASHLVHSSILKRTADPCKSKQRQTRAKDDSRVFPLHPWLNGRR